MIALTIFSFGAGQESTTLLHMLAKNTAFREKHFPGRLLVVGSDTGDEHSHTYKHVEETKSFCERNGIEFIWIINYNAIHIPFAVWPSNCLRCFYQSDIELIWLFKNEEAKFWEWVEMERAKLEKCEGAEKNFGVYGKKSLVEKLEAALIKYSHLTDEELNEYKFSHGHCIKSKY